MLPKLRVGFTLVELLVVIGIIAVLVAFLVVGPDKVKIPTATPNSPGETLPATQPAGTSPAELLFSGPVIRDGLSENVTKGIGAILLVLILVAVELITGFASSQIKRGWVAIGGLTWLKKPKRGKSKPVSTAATGLSKVIKLHGQRFVAPQLDQAFSKTQCQAWNGESSDKVAVHLSALEQSWSQLHRGNQFFILIPNIEEAGRGWMYCLTNGKSRGDYAISTVNNDQLRVEIDWSGMPKEVLLLTGSR